MFKVLTADNKLVNSTGKFLQHIRKQDDSTGLLQLTSTREGLLVVVGGGNDPDLRNMGNCVCPPSIPSGLFYCFPVLRVVEEWMV